MKTAKIFPVLALGLSATAWAQSTTMVETLTITASTVSAYSATEMDYTTAAYYCAIADAYLSVNGSIVQNHASADSSSPCAGGSVSISASTVLNASYQLQTNHWLVDDWGYFVNGVLQYEIDELGYSTVSPQGYTGQGTVNAPGGPINEYTTGFLEFYIGSTYLTQSTAPPAISGIDSSWPADGVLNSSGYTVLYGAHFLPGTGVSIDGSGVSMSLAYVDDGQVNLSYTISSSANTGAHNLVMSNTYGSGTAITFTVGDPTPNITSISPSTWQGDTGTSVTISGTGFGTNPTVSTNDSDAAFTVTSSSDTSITGTAFPSISDPGGTVTVSVTSTGYGSGFQQAAPGQSNQGNSTVQVVPAPQHVRVLVDQQGPPSACPTGIYVKQMQMQLVTSGNAAISNNVSIVETYSGLTTNTCGNGSPVASSCAATTGGGQFIDTMAVSSNFCGSGIVQGSACGFSLTSTWAACSNGLSNNLWTSPRQTLSNGVTVNSNSTQFAAGAQLNP